GRRCAAGASGRRRRAYSSEQPSEVPQETLHRLAAYYACRSSQGWAYAGFLSMRPQLHAVVEKAYEVFSDYRVRHSLSVCHCNCCMTEEHERALLKTPPTNIPASLLAEYTNSAHAWDDGPVAREM